MSDPFSDLLFEFVALSKRLPERGIMMYGLEILPGGYGSWTMCVQKNKEAFRFSFDGKDLLLRIEVSPVRHNAVGQQYLPNQWSVVEDKSFWEQERSEMEYVESFLETRLSSS